MRWSCEAATGFSSCVQDCGQDALITCCRMMSIGTRAFRMQGFFQQSDTGIGFCKPGIGQDDLSSEVLQVSADVHLDGCLNAGWLVQYTPPHLQRWKRADDSKRGVAD